MTYDHKINLHDLHVTNCRSRRASRPSVNVEEKETISDKGEVATNESNTENNESDALQSAIFSDQSVIYSQDDSDSDDEDKHRDLTSGNQTSPTLNRYDSKTESGVDIPAGPDSTSCTQTCSNMDECRQSPTSVPYRYV